jgi:AraC family carnitine catabolism transcriptional activator
MEGMARTVVRGRRSAAPARAEAITIDLVIVPPCAAIDACLAIDMLRLANQIVGRELFAVRTSSVDGRPVRFPAGRRLDPDAALGEIRAPGIVLLLAGLAPAPAAKAVLIRWLRQAAAHGATLMAADYGPLILAEAGLLEGYRATAHWEVLPAMAERWPRIELVEEICVADRNRVTCAGHAALFELLLGLVGERAGAEIGRVLAQDLVVTAVRPPGTRQRLPTGLGAGPGLPAPVAHALGLMQRHIEVPLALGRLAARCRLSLRQLEKLFRRALGASPGRVYQRLRLERGRELLLYSEIAVGEIALACGFASASAFCRAFKRETGLTAGGLRRSFRSRRDRRRVGVGQLAGRVAPTTLPVHRRPTGDA